MELSEIADYLDVSKRTLLDAIAREDYEPGISSGESHPSEASEVESAPNENSADGSTLDGTSRTNCATRGVRSLIDRAKVGLGLVVVLFESESHSNHVDRIWSSLRDLGDRSLRAGYEMLSEKASTFVDASGLTSLVAAVPLLSGLISIYTNRLRNRVHYLGIPVNGTSAFGTNLSIDRSGEVATSGGPGIRRADR